MVFLVTIVVCYLVVALIRKTAIKNEWLPLISGVLGATIVAILYFVAPAFVPVDEAILAIVYGFFCGLSATGSNQVFKQTLKYITARYGIKIPKELEDIHKEE